jgi:hypothetical protein
MMERDIDFIFLLWAHNVTEWWFFTSASGDGWEDLQMADLGSQPGGEGTFSSYLIY